jgi:hypothetical protein
MPKPCEKKTMKKNYIGIKVLKAEPMSSRDYNIYRGQLVSRNGNPIRKGYLVEYPDGYKSWSPKETFESSYFEMGEDPTKITPDMVKRFIGNNILAEQVDDKTTLVRIQTITGFRQYETSSCVDPDNYDEQIGTEICLKKAQDTMWKCLGFVLQWARCGLKNNA